MQSAAYGMPLRRHAHPKLQTSCEAAGPRAGRSSHPAPAAERSGASNLLRSLTHTSDSTQPRLCTHPGYGQVTTTVGSGCVRCCGGLGGVCCGAQADGQCVVADLQRDGGRDPARPRGLGARVARFVRFRRLRLRLESRSMSMVMHRGLGDGCCGLRRGPSRGSRRGLRPHPHSSRARTLCMCTCSRRRWCRLV